MKIKTAVNLVRYFSITLVAGILLLGYALVIKTHEGKLLVIEFAIGAASVILFIFRQAITTLAIRTSRYPGIVYGILDKLNLNRGLEISATDQMLEEAYGSSALSNQFLEENGLKTEIGGKRLGAGTIIVSLVFLGAMVLVMNLFINFKRQPAMLILPAAMLFMQVSTWIKRSKEPVEGRLIQFSSQGLGLEDTTLPWTCIYDWECYRTKQAPNQIRIHYHKDGQQVAEQGVDLSKLNIGKVDFLILLVYFKTLYGRVPAGALNLAGG